ncbi:hypothetical protein AX14_007035 [Amanita brunnescens Koide BX004]|nr:hypothetical protein AX14_007035 [Amanita brunnescens Koide BX004]
MPLFDCGYTARILEAIVMRPTEEYNSLALVTDAKNRRLDLPRPIRADVPIPNMDVHNPGPNKSYDDGVIYMRTRGAVAAQRAGSADSISPTVPPCSTMHTSGSWSVSSTGVLAARSIQFCMALATGGTI